MMEKQFQPKNTSKENKRYELSDEITAENVKQMGEFIALRAFKPFLRHADSILGNLYKGLIRDINRSNTVRHIFSDGYDIAQTAICFLCEHLGKTLNDVLGTDRRGKILTVKLACFRSVNRSINRVLAHRKRAICIDNVFESKAAVQFETDTEEHISEDDFTVVNETIEKLNLTDRQKVILRCLMDTNSYSEAARTLSLNKGTIWIIIMRIRKKYLRNFPEPLFRHR